MKREEMPSSELHHQLMCRNPARVNRGSRGGGGADPSSASAPQPPPARPATRAARRRASQLRWSSMIPTVRWEDDSVVLLDQRLLPGREAYLRCRDHGEVAMAIRDMAIRGAPAIGVAAALGLALGVRRWEGGAEALPAAFEAMCADLGRTRPTAVNLFWAIARMRRRFAQELPRGIEALREALLSEAVAIQREDLEACRRMGDLGAELVPAGARLLTHCNAGALATAGYGTALGVVRSAARQGKVSRVYAGETRPYLQGARLTAWELTRDRIPVTLIADNMAGHLMSRGEIDAVIVGADRIAANGD